LSSLFSYNSKILIGRRRMRAANFPVAGIRGHQFAACKRDNKRARMSDAITVSGDTDKEMHLSLSVFRIDLI
jgi:hypothetical protein